jgi:hypothetical protein
MTDATSRENGSPRRCSKLWIISVRPVTRRRRWRATGAHSGILYRDDLVRIVVDVPDSPRNRQWMKQFKDRWKVRLEQLELWMVSYRIEIE